MRAIQNMFATSLAFLLLLVSVSAFLSRTTSRTIRQSSMMMSTPGKTPLVANGKRFEADPGSSLIVVSITNQYET